MNKRSKSYFKKERYSGVLKDWGNNLLSEERVHPYAKHLMVNNGFSIWLPQKDGSNVSIDIPPTK